MPKAATRVYETIRGPAMSVRAKSPQSAVRKVVKAKCRSPKSTTAKAFCAGKANARRVCVESNNGKTTRVSCYKAKALKTAKGVTKVKISKSKTKTGTRRALSASNLREKNSAQLAGMLRSRGMTTKDYSTKAEKIAAIMKHAQKKEM